VATNTELAIGWDAPATIRAGSSGASASLWLWRLQIGLVILLPTALPLNLLAAGTAFWTWKQFLICLADVLFFFALRRREMQVARNNGLGQLFGALLVVWSASAMLSLASGVDAIRCLYSFFYYVGPIAFMLMPYLALRFARVRATLTAFIAVMTFCGVGLALDHFTGFPGALLGTMGWNAGDDGISLRRTTFFFEAPNNIFAFMSTGIILALWWQAHSKTQGARIVLIGCALAGTLGTVLTLTRTQWWGLGMLWSVAPIILYIRPSKTKARGAIPFFAAFLLASTAGYLAGADYVASQSKQAEAMVERGRSFFSTEDRSNETRYERWQAGVDLLGDPVNWVIGRGVGSGAGQLNIEKESVSNYESSFFLAFAEAGVLGLFLRYMPIVLLFALLKRSRGGGTMLGGLIKLWAVVWLVTTAAAPSAGAYHGMLALFFMVGLSAVSVDWESEMASDSLVG